MSLIEEILLGLMVAYAFWKLVRIEEGLDKLEKGSSDG